MYAQESMILASPFRPSRVPTMNPTANPTRVSMNVSSLDYMDRISR
jgi:hypothetical protein